MAEFSSNPDSRNKLETNFSEYLKRVKDAKANIEYLRISINRERNKTKLKPFLDNEEFEELIEDIELSNEALVRYLISYIPGLSVDDFIDNTYNKELFKYRETTVIDSRYLAEILNISCEEINDSFKQLNNEMRKEFTKSFQKTPPRFSVFYIDKSTYYIPYYAIIFFGLAFKGLNKKQLGVIVELVEKYEKDGVISLTNLLYQRNAKFKERLLSLHESKTSTID